MYSWLSEAVANNTVVITASRRLARVLRSDYSNSRLALGNRAWLTPDIKSIDAWLAATLDDTRGAAPIVLSGHASSIVWERCLGKRARNRLLNVGSFARQARQTWQRLCEWDVPLDEVVSSARSDDEKLFASAARRYRSLLAENNWIDSAQMSETVSQFLAGAAASVPESIIHAGFDRLSPSVERLFSVLSLQGCRVTAAADDAPPYQARVAVFDNAEAELRAAGAWARRRLAEDPTARTGIVFLGLDRQASVAERCVREGVAPGWQHGDAGLRTAVNTSYGRRLSEYPSIAITLLALRWLHTDLSFKQISPLLRSPFIAGDELPGRCKLELYLRRLPDQSWSPQGLARLFKDRVEEADAARWVECLDRLGRFRSAAARQASPVLWAERIDELVGSLMWPGAAALDSGEFQLVNRWRELLNEFAKLQIVSARMTLAEAGRTLATMANDIIFQPESDSAVVQLLGPLEAAGLRFDHLWIAGLDSDAWPPVAHPLALVSRELQKSYAMPDASPDDTLEYSRRVLNRLIASAGNVRLSWARSTDDAEKSASPLIAGFEIDQKPFMDPGWHAATLAGSQNMERVDNDRAPSVLKEETLAGGAYTVQRQVSNPFSAFAFGRLGVSEIASVAAGLSPRQRGSLLHAALHKLYADNPSRAEIRNWLRADARRRIGAAVDAALKRYRRHADAVLRRILELEHGRMCSLLSDFIEHEAQRSRFEVLSVERELEFSRFGVRLTIRPDRIDRLADSSLLVIDYKSGGRKGLLDRYGDIKDLQLVVYACAVDDDIGALALINIGSRSISYDSAGGSEEWDPKRADRWAERLSSWRDRVMQAMQQIAAGDARINLRLKTADARPLNILCRFEERKRGL